MSPVAAPPEKRSGEERLADFTAMICGKKSGDEWKALCPIHGDHNESFYYRLSTDCQSIIGLCRTCKAGGLAVAMRIGFPIRDMFGDDNPESRRRSEQPKVFATLEDAIKHLAKRFGKRVIIYLYHHADGSVAGAVLRFETTKGKEIRPVWKDAAGWHIGAIPSPRPIYDIVEVAAAEQVQLVEGEKAAEVAKKLGFVATTSIGGSSAPSKTDWTTLAGKDVYCLPDNDDAGRIFIDIVAAKLVSLDPPARVFMVPLPVIEKGDDVADWHARGGTAEQLRELIAAATPWIPPTSSPIQVGDLNRAMIEVTPDEHIVIGKTLVALAKDSAIFHRAGRLVHVVHMKSDADEDGILRSAGTPRIQLVSPPHLRERLSAQCRFHKIVGEGESEKQVQVPPPRFAVDAIAMRGFWHELRQLSGITETPVLRNDGSILETPGWDESTGLIYEPGGAVPEIPESPGLDDAIAARDIILELVCDFPFATPAHRASWMAGVLTPFARRAFSGPAPIFVIDANVRASGKSLLTDIIALLFTGRPMPRLSNPGDDDEARKRITSLMIAGDPLGMIDNIVGPLGSGALDAVLTATTWKDRRLGNSEVIEVPARMVWYATGNNISMTCDTSRRACHIRLDSPLENPEERTGFRCPDLIARIRRDRLKLLTACLVILRAFVLAGRPNAGLKPWGSFEGWSALIRNALVWIGLPDPGETRQELAESSDRDASALRSLFAGWSDIDPGGQGLTSAELLTRLDNAPCAYDGVRTAVMELCGTTSSKLPSVRQLGNQLRRFRGRVMGGQCLEMHTGHARTNRWKVVVVNLVNQGESFPDTLRVKKESELCEAATHITQGRVAGSVREDSPDAPHSPTGCPGCGFPSDTDGPFCTLCGGGAVQ